MDSQTPLLSHLTMLPFGEDLNPTIGQTLEDPIDEMPMNLHTQGDHGSLMEIMLEKNSIPLFEGSSTSMFLALLLLFNVRITHGVNNSLMDELFALTERTTTKGEQVTHNHI
jgi:hypothetical protein